MTKPKTRSALRTQWFRAGMILCSLGVLLTGVVAVMAAPRIEQLTYQYEGKDPEPLPGTMPLYVQTIGEHLNVWFHLHLSPLSTRRFILSPDDCIDQLTVNGQDVQNVVGMCGHNDRSQIDLSSVLHTGDNDIILRIKDNGGLGGLFLQTDLLGMQGVFIVLFLLFGTALGVLWMYSRTRLQPWIPTWLAFALGTTLRILYVHVSPFTLRGHDTDAHIDYITYIAQHWAIPPAIAGWEYHQPPLYYFLSAVWLRLGFGGDMNGLFLQQLQYFSLFCSLVAFIAAVWAGWMLLRKQGPIAVALFSATIAVIPSLIFVAGRVSNDTLSHALTLLSFALLIRWWQTGKLLPWMLLCLCLALSFLTKISILLLLPVCAICLLLRPKMPWKTRLTQGLLFCALFGALTAWYPAYRLFIEADPSKTLSLGNQGMQDGLLVKNSVENFLTFNPAEILRHPFNNPWNDPERRQFFWEYFFRSAFFGEFGFDRLRELSKYLLASALLLLPLLPLGVWHDFRRRSPERWLILLSLAALLGAALSYRFKFTYAPNQDFRFTMLALLPLTYYAMRGMDVIKKDLRYVVIGIMSSLLISCAIFIVHLSLQAS